MINGSVVYDTTNVDQKCVFFIRDCVSSIHNSVDIVYDNINVVQRRIRPRQRWPPSAGRPSLNIFDNGHTYTYTYDIINLIHIYIGSILRSISGE